ncbi:hypothetical protein F5H01DRAFT_44961 [Linnemannia elongata]|nr:hypothetical protein F5H01DRAFT_44961 [Linnemannia elongata]
MLLLTVHFVCFSQQRDVHSPILPFISIFLLPLPFLPLCFSSLLCLFFFALSLKSLSLPACLFFSPCIFIPVVM